MLVMFNAQEKCHNYFPLMNFKYDSGLKNQRQKQKCVCVQTYAVCAHTCIFVKKK